MAKDKSDAEMAIERIEKLLVEWEKSRDTLLSWMQDPKMYTGEIQRDTMSMVADGLNNRIVEVQAALAGRPESLEEAWHDPTHGRIDRDIQEQVNMMKPSSLGARVALENTLQNRRNRDAGRPEV